MIKFPHKVPIVITILSGMIFSGCNDENIINSYLRLTKSNRIDEGINLDKNTVLINVCVMGSGNDQAGVKTNIGVTLPDGRVFTKSTNDEGKISFIIDRNVFGKVEITAETSDNLYKGVEYIEISETLNYSIAIYLREQIIR